MLVVVEYRVYRVRICNVIQRILLSDGAGAEARSSIGWVVFGGLGLAVMFTLFLTPAVYALIAGLSAPRAESGRRLTEELQASHESTASTT